jgi:type IV secretory pathway TraG/TraD family ATPase VirD4
MEGGTMFLLKGILAHPGRAVLIALGAIAGVVGLGMVTAQSGQTSLVELAAVVAVAAGLLAIRVPRQVVLGLTVAAVVAVGVVSVVPGVIAAGPLPVGILILGVAWLVWAWSGLGLLQLPPSSRGARFATVRELREAGFLTPHGWTVGSIGRHTLRFPELREREGIIVSAGVGSGKTAGPAMTAILSEAERPAAARRTVVIADPKDGELTRQTLPTLARTHSTLIWDPSNPDSCTVFFDPLRALPEPSDESFVGEVKEIARAWFEATRGATGHTTEPPFFINQPRSLMEALFLAFVVTHPQGTFVELADWNSALTIEAFQDLLDQSAHPAVHASAEALRAVGLNERTIGPIWGDILQRWDILIDPRVRRSMSGPPIDWSSLIRQPSALYLRIGAKDAERLQPLLSLALGQMYREVTKIAARYPNNVLPLELRVIMDEFGNLPRIYGIETALATLRSYGVGHYLFVQNCAQIIHRYGRELGKSIQDSIVTKVILGGAAFDDAKAFSERCGEITEHVPTQSWTANGMVQRSTTRSHSPDRRPLISATDIVHMSGTVLVSTRGVMPICAALRMYFEDPALVRRLEEDRREYERRCAANVAAAMPDACAVRPSPTVSPPRVPAIPAQRSEGRIPTVSNAPLPPLTGDERTPAPDRRTPPPPGCTPEEWEACAPALVTFIGSAEDDLFSLVTGRISSLEELHMIWQYDPERSTPARYATITAKERADASMVAHYADELAVRLQLCDDEPPAATM